MMRVWFLIFMFGTPSMPVASGPHELDVCLEMAQSVVRGHCWNPVRPWDRMYPLIRNPAKAGVTVEGK